MGREGGLETARVTAPRTEDGGAAPARHSPLRCHQIPGNDPARYRATLKRPGQAPPRSAGGRERTGTTTVPVPIPRRRAGHEHPGRAACGVQPEHAAAPQAAREQRQRHLRKKSIA